MEDCDWLSELREGRLKGHELEARMRAAAPSAPWTDVVSRAAAVRRAHLEEVTGAELEALSAGSSGLAVTRGDRELLRIENAVGTIQIPLGVAGPLPVLGSAADGTYWLPLATNEAALVAGVNRGASLIRQGGHVQSRITKDGMTRAPLVRFRDEASRDAVFAWVTGGEARVAFEAATRKKTAFGQYLDVVPIPDPSYPRWGYLRFRFFTGDAMGMNMVTVATDACLGAISERFDGFEVIALSGNLCSDKKQTRVNVEKGRGLSVEAQATIPAKALEAASTSAGAVALVNEHKNVRGGDLAGTIGGYNAHAANPLAALFAATGQDLAQVVESASCFTDARATRKGDLEIAVRLPCIEVGTVGGGTTTPSALACLGILGLAGGGSPPGAHRRALGEVVAGAVLAGELNLLTALARGELASSHEKLTR